MGVSCPLNVSIVSVGIQVGAATEAGDGTPLSPSPPSTSALCPRKSSQSPGEIGTIHLSEGPLAHRTE